jgi:hypothetical protein
MEGMRRLIALHPRPDQERLQAVRRIFHFHPRKIQLALQAMQGVWRLTFEFGIGNRVIIVNKKSRNKRTSIQII